MQRTILTVLVLACGGLSTPAMAQAAAPAWAVNAEPARGTLTRGRGPAGDTIMSLTTLAGSDSYRLTIAGPAIARREAGLRFPVTIALTAADARFPTTGAGATLSGGRGALIAYNLKAEFVTALGNATALTVSAGHDNAGPYEVPKARGAAAAFAKCVRDQLMEWGADPAQFAAGGATPVALQDRAMLIGLEKIPRLSLPSHGMIAFAFRFAVAADGSIDGCTPLDAAPRADNTKTVCGAVMGKKLF